ncbi:hypothetical protein HMPREF9446_01799 [Bacteroides fluxus YIT 12057]|uniref:Uncharacterized protein n=1 Tax=Bacteroides fluxus YIT 12057 TaxID=763034 RepID=F3PST7_9BACE|nr:hypothetical protein HMPREF9446_01799 [Bacteroides fluxus YIT 12057]
MSCGAALLQLQFHCTTEKETVKPQRVDNKFIINFLFEILFIAYCSYICDI